MGQDHAVFDADNHYYEAMDAFTTSRGRVAAVSDEQILDAYRWLAAGEGVFCEPASAASVASTPTRASTS